MKKKIQLTKPGPAVGLGYPAGSIIELEELQALELIAMGHACLPEVDEEEVNALPADLPARDQLFKAGLTNITDVAAVPDFAEIAGIGKKTAEKIMEYLIDKEYVK